MDSSSSDENDYMSDSFLQNISGEKDIRPGLIKCHAQQYNHKLALKKTVADKINRSANSSQKEREACSRENGLKQALNSENVGFKILQKFGFKPGSGLGKSGEGRIEPVPLEIKTDRQGLGRKSYLEEIALLKAKYKSEEKKKLTNIDDYRSRKAGEASEKRSALDLIKSQRVCWELDSKACIEEPEEVWFWPECKLLVSNEVDDLEDETATTNDKECFTEDEEYDENKDTCDEEEVCDENEDSNEEEKYDQSNNFSVQEKLEMLTLYLRQTYLYCVWCGHSFEDEKDLQQDCPGLTREDH